jgi:hypothetical protein
MTGKVLPARMMMSGQGNLPSPSGPVREGYQPRHGGFDGSNRFSPDAIIAPGRSASAGRRGGKSGEFEGQERSQHRAGAEIGNQG